MLHRSEWTRRMDEYRDLLKATSEADTLHSVQQPFMGERAGLIAEYTGVHRESSRNTLKVHR